jgi:nitrate reductase gamma subunit
LVSRLVRSELRQASVRSDYFNLIILLGVSLAGLVAWLTVDSDFALLRRLVQDLLAFEPVGELPGPVTVQVWLISALLVYFPFTHMTHMFSKFFTYHSVRWEDQPNIRGGRIEQAVIEALGQPITWSAPHIKRDTWAGAATDTKKSGHE